MLENIVKPHGCKTYQHQFSGVKVVNILGHVFLRLKKILLKIIKIAMIIKFLISLKLRMRVLLNVPIFTIFPLRSVFNDSDFISF